MAIAVIGGMLSSTLLTLVVVPVVYSLAEQGLQRLHRRSA
jgi:HAE1 family hydrophobic/amphiphilic exporter-1